MNKRIRKRMQWYDRHCMQCKNRTAWKITMYGDLLHAEEWCAARDERISGRVMPCSKAQRNRDIKLPTVKMKKKAEDRAKEYAWQLEEMHRIQQEILASEVRRIEKEAQKEAQKEEEEKLTVFQRIRRAIKRFLKGGKDADS